MNTVVLAVWWHFSPVPPPLTTAHDAAAAAGKEAPGFRRGEPRAWQGCGITADSKNQSTEQDTRDATPSFTCASISEILRRSASWSALDATADRSAPVNCPRDIGGWRYEGGDETQVQAPPARAELSSYECPPRGNAFGNITAAAAASRTGDNRRASCPLPGFSHT